MLLKVGDNCDITVNLYTENIGKKLHSYKFAVTLE